MSRNAQTESPDDGAGREAGSMQDIEAALAAIRADLADLARSVRLFGQDSANAARAEASAMTTEMVAAARKSIAELRAELDRLEKRLEENVADKPLPWLVGAMGLGALIALALRRNR